MENPLNITALNDFIFCPVSIYFHMLYDNMDNMLYQTTSQINGTGTHKTIDSQKYTGPAAVQGLTVYSEKYNLLGKIDLYLKSTQTLIERKKKVKAIYDGYVFQLYGQYFALCEMGYVVKSLLIHSVDDNKNYSIPLPEEDKEMFSKFKKLIEDIENFDISDFEQTNAEKCRRCIYAPYCDREVK